MPALIPTIVGVSTQFGIYVLNGNYRLTDGVTTLIIDPAQSISFSDGTFLGSDIISMYEAAEWPVTGNETAAASIEAASSGSDELTQSESEGETEETGSQVDASTDSTGTSPIGTSLGTVQSEEADATEETNSQASATSDGVETTLTDSTGNGSSLSDGVGTSTDSAENISVTSSEELSQNDEDGTTEETNSQVAATADTAAGTSVVTSDGPLQNGDDGSTEVTNSQVDATADTSAEISVVTSDGPHQNADDGSTEETNSQVGATADTAGDNSVDTSGESLQNGDDGTAEEINSQVGATADTDAETSVVTSGGPLQNADDGSTEEINSQVGATADTGAEPPAAASDGPLQIEEDGATEETNSQVGTTADTGSSDTGGNVDEGAALDDNTATFITSYRIDNDINLTNVMNVAASQSSTHAAHAGMETFTGEDAYRVIDNDVTTHNHTNVRNGANSVTIDLNGDALIEEISLENGVWNATAANRLIGASVQVLKDGNVVWDNIADGDGPLTQAQYQSLVLNQAVVGDQIVVRNDTFIHLKEVDVFGHLNLTDTMDATASSSSTWQNNDALYGAANVLDGDTATFSHPHHGDTSTPWLEVDLGADAFIETVAIFNRNDSIAIDRADVRERLAGATLEVLDDGEVVGEAFTLTGDVNQIIDVGGLFGDTVRISNNDQYLHIAELDVFGISFDGFSEAQLSEIKGLLHQLDELTGTGSHASDGHGSSSQEQDTTGDIGSYSNNVLEQAAVAMLAQANLATDANDPLLS